MSADSPDEHAETVDPADSESGVDESKGDAATTSDDETNPDRSYEQRVLDELVPEISVGDSDPANGDGDSGPSEDSDHDPADAGSILGMIDSEPPAETTIDETDSGLADALDKLDEELQQAFIRIVVGIKAGVLLISAGILAIGFQGMTTLGGLIAVGGLAFARAGHRYWAYEHESDESHNG